LLRVDIATRKVTGKVSFPWPPGRIATSGNSVWVTQDGGPEVWQVDAVTGRVSRRVSIRGGANEGDVAYGDGSLWLASGAGVIRRGRAVGGERDGERHLAHRSSLGHARSAHQPQGRADDGALPQWDRLGRCRAGLAAASSNRRPRAANRRRRRPVRSCAQRALGRAGPVRDVRE